MAPEAATYIWDAIGAAERVMRFSGGKSFADYLNDELLRSGIERQFEILGEALSQLRKCAPEVANNIADLPRAVALRNILIHAYADVDSVVVWGVVEKHLGPLLQNLKTLLPDLSDPA